MDLIVYLLLLQLLTGVVVVQPDRTAQARAAVWVLPTQVLMLLVFWLVWGGYSIDAWRYLMGFWGSISEFKKEWLFWSSGWLLSRLTADPWPMKILSAIATLATSLAILHFHRQRAPWLQSLALSSLLLLPAFFLAFGNALRQGLGAAAITVGLLYIARNRYWPFAVAVAIAFLFHQTTMALAVAILAARFIPGALIVPALLIAPLASYLLDYVASLFGTSLSAYVRYWDYSEGSFHLAKFFLSYSLAWFLWFATRNQDAPTRLVALSYGWMVCISALLLKFEVPFERFLLYSDFLLPFALPAALATRTEQHQRLRYAVFSIAVTAGLLLWHHRSISEALGYI